MPSVNAPIARFSALVACGLACAAPAAAQRQSVRMPYRVVGGQVVVTASIGGGESQPAVLDPGTPRTLVTQALASRLLLPGGAGIDLPTLYGPLHAAQADPQTLRIGAITVPGAAIAICDMWAQLSSVTPKDRPDVWIGAQALANLAVTIDPASQTIAMTDNRVAVPRGAIAVPFEVTDGRVWIEVRAEGSRRYRAIVTTASTGTFLPASVARGLKLKTVLTLPVKHPGGKAGTAAVVQMTRVTIGALEVPQVPAIAILDGDPGGIDPEVGVIGTDILFDYRVTFNFPLRRLVFEPLTGPAPATAPGSPGRRRQPAMPSMPVGAPGIGLAPSP